MKAIWNGTTIAQSDNTVIIEGNHYFPFESVDESFLERSESHTTCHWKGEASYYHIVVNGEKNEDAAWYYPNPSKAAEKIVGRVAFWKGVEVKE